MKLRPHKIGLLAGPVFLIAGALIVGMYAWSMNWVLVNTVHFEGEAKSISRDDQRLIRKLILQQNELQNPKNALARFTVTFNKKISDQTWSGIVKANTMLESDAVVDVTEQNDNWQISFWGNAK